MSEQEELCKVLDTFYAARQAAEIIDIDEWPAYKEAIDSINAIKEQ